jgi:LPXTG-site transpeptidase (sortase) family protein
MPKPSAVTIKRRQERHWLVISIPLPSFAWTARIRQHTADYALSTLLFLGGCVGILYVLLQPLIPVGTTNPPVQAIKTAAVSQQPAGLARSIPTHLEIPDISVSTDLVELGKNDDGSLEVPDDYTHAGWYRYSPTPGEIGPAIIAGHVDNYLGPAVFFRLKDLQKGQPIYVTRQDGDVVHFTVDGVQLFEQDNFPTDAVYGNIDYPGLRLITCGGTYSAFTNRYSHNVVVYASYTAK